MQNRTRSTQSDPSAHAFTRREFTGMMLAGAAGLALPGRLGASPWRQDTYFTWQEVAPGVRAAIGGGGNVLLVASGGEALVSDAKNLGLGHTLRREAEAFGTPVTVAVNTHHHGDHIGGNVAFAGDLPLIANPNAQRRVREQAEAIAGQTNDRISQTIDRMSQEGVDPRVIDDLIEEARSIERASAEDLTPNETFETEREVRVGDRTVLLRHVGAGHTDNDVFLHLPEVNVIHTGDLLFVGRHGFMDQNGGVDSEGWQRSLRAMIDLCDADTVVVSGHGEIVGRAGLERQYEYFDQLRAAVETAVSEGRSKDEVEALQPDSLADISGSPARNLGVVYDEVTG
ncbi:MAG TPA: MBL fold metallo-hydrolase [Longimicrobiales bacterium]|nr:MBL fold metallo-hydrolase [Longimicrobiales bacterium]